MSRCAGKSHIFPSSQLIPQEVFFIRATAKSRICCTPLKLFYLFSWATLDWFWAILGSVELGFKVKSHISCPCVFLKLFHLWSRGIIYRFWTISKGTCATQQSRNIIRMFDTHTQGESLSREQLAGTSELRVFDTFHRAKEQKRIWSADDIQGMCRRNN